MAARAREMREPRFLVVAEVATGEGRYGHQRNGAAQGEGRTLQDTPKCEA